jgi:hypothetical protein
MKTSAGPALRIEERPTRIGTRHLERLAIVYVRQTRVSRFCSVVA